jgi:hypothetical protein
MKDEPAFSGICRNVRKRCGCGVRPEEGEEDNWIFISGHRAAALALLRCLFSMSRSFFRLAQLESSIMNQPSIFLCFCDVAPVSTVSRVVKVSWY